MAYIDDISLWAENLTVDPEKQTVQRLDISDNLWQEGWLRQNPAVMQHLNQLFYLITGALLEQNEQTFELFYPVGITVIMIDDPTNPNTLFGFGTWETADIGLGGTETSYAWKRTA